MSTEREVGSTGPQGEQPSGQGVVGPAPDGPAQQSAAGPAPAATPAADQPAPAAPAAEGGSGGFTPTVAFGKVPAPDPAPAAPTAPAPVPPVAEAPTAPAPAAAPGYLDAPPPVLPPAPAPAAPAAPAAPVGNPYATPAPGTPVPPLAAAHDPYGTHATHAGQAALGAPAAHAAHDPYGAPAAPHAPGATGQHHHPFGAGQPLGGWGGAHDITPGAPGTPGGPGGPLGYPGEYPGAPGGPRKKRGGLIALVAAVALIAGVAGGAVGVVVADRDDVKVSAKADHSSTTVQANNTQKNEPAPGSVAGIAQKALPSVVTIKAQGNGESGTGTGFVFDTEGHILTNNHVVAPASSGGKLTVKFADGSSYNASVLGRAEGYDVAVIKLDSPPKGKLTPLPLADSDKVNVGDSTIAIGAPYGLESTVTTGIISAKDRPVASGDETGAQASYMNALQTDASINPGNSGGPLLDSGGAVIGINSAIQSNTSSNGRAGSIGLGFAIPINQAKWVADTLIKTGKPVYAKLDVLRNDDYKGDGAQIQTRDVQGQSAVTPGGAADKAGLKPGDVITKLGGSPIENGPALVSKIWTHKPGETVDVEYTRNGQTFTTKVTLGERVGDN
ncbi:trypsin-like peptidase domain-containing protein [Kitasatospora sp. NPDC093806]|uniref:S1C family serine protease n=1 Tax=Kitasatospora sp. NPDC093806 TaxID=3155075 RepID=UPI0034235870